MTELALIFAKGSILGFLLAMVIGPIGIFCIQQTLSSGFWSGIAVGLGAAIADGTYAMLAGFGLSYITDFLVHQQFWLQVIGGIFLCYLGLQALLSKPIEESDKSAINYSFFRLFISTLFLTLANPVTILTFSALITTFGITAHTMSSIVYAIILLVSTFLGSLSWWIMLSGSLTFLRHKISLAIINKINFVAGVIMLIFGILAIATVLI